MESFRSSTSWEAVHFRLWALHLLIAKRNHGHEGVSSFRFSACLASLAICVAFHITHASPRGCCSFGEWKFTRLLYYSHQPYFASSISTRRWSPSRASASAWRLWLRLWLLLVEKRRGGWHDALAEAATATWSEAGAVSGRWRRQHAGRGLGHGVPAEAKPCTLPWPDARVVPGQLAAII
jgi:hypothetical protein